MDPSRITGRGKREDALVAGASSPSGAGLLVLAGALLALTVNPLWIFLCGFIGLGLTFAGLTDSARWGSSWKKCPEQAESLPD